MLSSLESGLGLDIVKAIQDTQNGLFDTVAEVLDFAGSSLFYILLLSLIHWSVHKQLGRRLLFGLLLSSVVVLVLKEGLQTPRPFQAFPDDVRQLFDATGFGLPSGHTANAMMLGTLLALHLKRRWVWIAVAVYVLLMGWSRIYAGVHYPQDVIGSIVLVPLLVWVFLRLEDWVMQNWAQLPVRAGVAAVVLIGLVMFLFIGAAEDGQVVTAIWWGVGLGVILEVERIHFGIAGDMVRRVGSYVVGIILLLILFFGLRAIFESLEPEEVFRLIRYGLVGLFALGIWPLIGQRFRLFEG